MILYRPKRWYITQPCARIVGFRNRIVHEYAEVDADIVWAIVQNEVPRLLASSASIPKEPEHGG